MRQLLPLTALLCLTSCILPSVKYGETPWSDYVENAHCQGEVSVSRPDLPYFLITSRLPDCRSDPATLTIQRGDRLRYGRFGRPEWMTSEEGGRYERGRFVFQSEAGWWAAFDERARANDGRVMLYVHGFNERLPSTSKDAADMARFSGFEGPVIKYSWPSRGEVLAYGIDENNAEYEEDYFSAILRNIVSRSSVKQLILVAHSMGSRLAIPAVEAIDRDHPDVRAKVSNIILASPDYDSGLFIRKARYNLLNPARAPQNRQITVYTSRKDLPISFSRFLHGYSRLGNPSCDDPVAERQRRESQKLPRCYPEFPGTIDGLAIVDTTSISDSKNGHNDFLRTPQGCADFAHVLNADTSWPGRIAISGAGDYVWQLSQSADVSACRNSATPES